MARTRRIRYVRLALLMVTVVVTGVLLVRAIFVSEAVGPVTPSSEATVDARWAAERLAGSIRFRTLSDDDGSSDPRVFSAFHQYLRESFPRVHETLRPETVGRNALLFRWDGRGPKAAPILLVAHMDVVPVEPGTESQWTHPPFAGAIEDEFIWGRGTLDDKVGVIGILCAVEQLLGEGFVPRRTVYVAFGDDEEVGGLHGAAAIAARFREQGVHFEVVLDEGGIVLNDGLPGLDVPAALVGVAEKGYASLALTVRGEGGHSSMPPPQTSLGVLAAGIARIERQPMAADLRAPTDQTVQTLATAMPFGHRLVLANLWLFEPLVRWGLSQDPSSNALVRTTLAAPLFHAGTADNVLPVQARAVVNFRILPGETVDDVHDHVVHAVDDPRVEIEVLPDARNPSTVSSVSTPGFAGLRTTIRRVFRRAVVAPYLVVGGTDARHYEGLAAGVYRFLPVALAVEDRPRIHGTNERIRVEDFARVVHFYQEFIREMTGPKR